MTEEKALQFYNKCSDTFLSLIRVCCKTKFVRFKPITRQHDQCVIMGNGPSLIPSLQENKDRLPDCDLIAVNFFGLSPEYSEYKPSIYILCDPAFWLENISEDLTEKVKRLYHTIVKTTIWDLQIFLPYNAKKQDIIEKILSQNTHIQIRYFNKTKFEGFDGFKYWIWNKQWGMPRTQNILIAALMLAINSKYNTIYLAGADNDWMKNLWVDEKNRIHRDDFHFYKDNDINTYRVLSEKIHECHLQAYYTFLSYFNIRKFIDQNHNIQVINLCSTSFIDSFDKKKMISK